MCPFQLSILRSQIRHIKKLYFYFIIIISDHIIQAEMVPYVPISPCKVHNTLLQPNFGISARTRKIVEIVQAPPLFTQTVQAGLCLESTSNPSDAYENGSSTTPPYICRQRYTSIELFSKLGISDANLHSGRSILNILKLPEGILSRGIKKDFILIEAGCDFLFEHSTFSMPLNHPKHYQGGVSSFEETEKKPFKSPSYIDVIQPDNHSGGRERNFKAWSMMRRHFFRHSLHLNLNLTSKNIIEKGSDEFDSPELGTVRKLLPPTATSDQSSTDQKESEERSLQLEDDYENGILEIELKPEDIGLPVLFLVPSLDPVLHIISSLKEN